MPASRVPSRDAKVNLNVFAGCGLLYEEMDDSRSSRPARPSHAPPPRRSSTVQAPASACPHVHCCRQLAASVVMDAKEVRIPSRDEVDLLAEALCDVRVLREVAVVVSARLLPSRPLRE